MEDDRRAAQRDLEVPVDRLGVVLGRLERQVQDRQREHHLGEVARRLGQVRGEEPPLAVPRRVVLPERVDLDQPAELLDRSAACSSCSPPTPASWASSGKTHAASCAVSGPLRGRQGRRPSSARLSRAASSPRNWPRPSASAFVGFLRATPGQSRVLHRRRAARSAGVVRRRRRSAAEAAHAPRAGPRRASWTAASASSSSRGERVVHPVHEDAGRPAARGEGLPAQRGPEQVVEPVPVRQDQVEPVLDMPRRSPRARP